MEMRGRGRIMARKLLKINGKLNVTLREQRVKDAKGIFFDFNASCVSLTRALPQKATCKVGAGRDL